MEWVAAFIAAGAVALSALQLWWNTTNNRAKNDRQDDRDREHQIDQLERALERAHRELERGRQEREALRDENVQYLRRLLAQPERPVRRRPPDEEDE